MTKVAFVVQRYGLEVHGGSEFHCRAVVERLRDAVEVEVATTCAVDYMSWKDAYPAGRDEVNGVPVWRFPVDAPRDVARFNRLSQRVLLGAHSREDEYAWMRSQGPYSTAFLEFLRNHRRAYDVFVFFTYLYGTTFFGLPLVKERSILVPTLHDEPPVYLGIYGELFQLPRGIIFNTPEERQFVAGRFPLRRAREVVAGVGIDLERDGDARRFRDRFGVEGPFLLYVGRVDPSKGCGELFAHFRRYARAHPGKLKLVVVGKAVMPMPKHADIVPLGFVSEEDKVDAYKAACALVMPSRYESLSMVLLEAWAQGTPALANGTCRVLVGQCRRSGGGFYYTTYAEFEECLRYLLENTTAREQMGKSGRAYVEERYRWEDIREVYLDMIEWVAGGAGEGPRRRGE